MRWKIGSPVKRPAGPNTHVNMGLSTCDSTYTAGRFALYFDLGRVMESRREKGLSVDVYTVPVVKPLNARQLCELSMRYDQLIIVEENQKSGGIGSALIEVLSDSYNNGLLSRYPKVSRVAIDDMYLQITGSQRYLQEAAGLVL